MILPDRVLGSAGVNWIRSGAARAPISWRTSWISSLRSVVAAFFAGIQRHVGVDRLALDLVREGDDRRLGDRGMRDQRAFDFGGADAVAGDVDDVVDAAGDPVIAVLVAAAAVAGEIEARIGREIGLEEAAMIAPDRAHLAGP